MAGVTTPMENSRLPINIGQVRRKLHRMEPCSHQFSARLSGNWGSRQQVLEPRQCSIK